MLLDKNACPLSLCQVSRLAASSTMEAHSAAAVATPTTAETADSGLTARPGPGGWPDVGYLFSLADTAIKTAVAEGAQVNEGKGKRVGAEGVEALGTHGYGRNGQELFCCHGHLLIITPHSSEYRSGHAGGRRWASGGRDRDQREPPGQPLAFCIQGGCGVILSLCLSARSSSCCACPPLTLSPIRLAPARSAW